MFPAVVKATDAPKGLGIRVNEPLMRRRESQTCVRWPDERDTAGNTL
jgi:hypothetical protein